MIIRQRILKNNPSGFQRGYHIMIFVLFLASALFAIERFYLNYLNQQYLVH